MINESTVKIYINTSKPYYYPGEKFAATILLDVSDTTKCDKMLIIAKGKEIVKAIQKTYIYSDNDYEEEEENSNESDDDRKNRRRRSDYITDNSESEEKVKENDNSSIDRQLNDTLKIFKYKKIIQISNNKYLEQGKYSFPFEIDLPEKIPGTFLFMEHNTYIEIIYSVKVKLNQINIKEAIPIVIRQNEKIFNYQNSNEFTKKIMSCCFDNYESTIKLSTLNKYTLSNDQINLNVLIDTKKSDIQGSPITVELYQKVIIFPKHRDKRIKITKLVGNYSGKKEIHQRCNTNKNIAFLMDKSYYAEKHLQKTKSIKYFRHKDVIPFLNQSIKSDFVICEYEAYAEVKFQTWSIEELGCFLPVLIYPPEKGIVSKTITQKGKEFLNSIKSKKIFLNKETKDYDPEFGNKNKGKYYKKNKYYDDSDSESDDDNRKKRKKSKKKKLENKENNDDDNDNNIDINLDINKYKDNSPNTKMIKDNNHEEEANKAINDKNFVGNYEKKKKNIVKIDTNSNNIKKEFNQSYLDDALDDEFLENSSSQ